MKMTPLDVRQRRFAQTFRGFTPSEVESFLEVVASEFEDVIRENISLRENAARLAAALDQHLEREKALQETMITAQRISEDVRLQARKEAENIIAEAELQAEKIVTGANNRLVGLVGEINELKRQRIRFESELDSLIDSHRRLLDAFKVPREGDVAFLVKRTGES